MIGVGLASLDARSPHVVPVDPSLVSQYVQQGFMQGYISVATLTLILYNASCVARFLSIEQDFSSNQFLSDNSR